MQPILKSAKLANVCYDIRGPVLAHAKKMEEDGQRIIKLNIGNPATFGFETPEEIVEDMIRNLPAASGYSDSKGLFSARKAIMHYCQQKGIANVKLDDIYVGNGVSELIVMGASCASCGMRSSTSLAMILRSGRTLPHSAASINPSSAPEGWLA